MANSDKADAASQKEIEALKAEFGTELNNLGVRVDNLEKNASNVKFTGEVRSRYEYSDDSTTADNKNISKTRIRIYMTAPVAENVTFKGRLASESNWGNEVKAGNTTTNEVKLDQAYITGNLGGLTYAFGRQPVALGQKLLVSNSGNNDGLFLSGGKDIRVTVGAFKLNDGLYSNNYTAGNIDFKLSKNFNLSASYLGDDADDNANQYDSTAAGLKYTGLKNFTVTGEYAQNDSDWAKSQNDGDKSKAWASRIKYLGADSSKVHSYGLYVSYRKAEAGFDNRNLNDFSDMTNWNGLKEMDDIKGLDYGFEYTLFKNGILRLQYNDMQDEKTGDVDKKNMFAELVYTF